MVGVVLYVTFVPEQIAPLGFAPILILAGKFALTVIVKMFDVAGDPVAQVALAVKTQLIKLPFAKVDEEYVEFVAPLINEPLFFH